jgi:hypothetical protein
MKDLEALAEPGLFWFLAGEGELLAILKCAAAMEIAMR